MSSNKPDFKLSSLAMVSQIIKTILFFLILSFNLPQTNSASAREKPPFIRVAILSGIENFSLNIEGSFRIYDLETERLIYKGRDLLDNTVYATKECIKIGEHSFQKYGLKIVPYRHSVVLVNNRRFGGEIQIILKGDSGFLVVNKLNIEDYTKGVLYHEASHYWPEEALKAQAVVVRTYALYQKATNKDKDYDVSKDIYSQVYGGKTSERSRTNRAVDNTRSRILTYDKKVFPSFYHATCAGHTEDAGNLWDIDIPPLKGVKCGFCKDSPHYSWEISLSQDEIEKKLKANGWELGKLNNIEILTRNKSNRIDKIKISGKNKSKVIPAKDFRNILGPNVIRSTNFTLKLEKNYVNFKGLGWGHGVGLCQWGSYFMAKEGWKYLKILRYYYPQAEITSYKRIDYN